MARTRPAAPPTAPDPPPAGIFCWLRRTFLRTAGYLLAASAILALAYGWLASRYDLAALGRMPERSIVFDADGSEIGRIHGEDRTVVPLDRISPVFIQALLAREDDRFYQHHGVDLKGIARAIFRRFTDGAQQGASTISMQLARNGFDLTRQKSLHRKLLEIALTLRIEASLSKDQILEHYLNRIFFGTGLHGVERATQAYFGKPAISLTIDEAAMLAAIIRGPNRFSPFRHYEKAMSGRNMVLDRMVTTGRLRSDAAEAAKRTKTRVLPEPPPPRSSWAIDAVRRELARLLDSTDIAEGGLLIHTTINSRLQQATEASLATELARIESLPGYQHQSLAGFLRSLATHPGAEPAYLQSAAIVIDNSSGAILACTGGRDASHSSFNRALSARRAAGSTFKPFVYAAALENGLLPSTLLSDDPLKEGEIQSAHDPSFQPTNADQQSHGLQRADWGLARSRNTMAVRAGEFAGIDAVRETAHRCGLGDPASSSAQLYLGNTPVTLEQLTTAFTVFPRGGSRPRPFLIDRVTDSAGRLVFRSGTLSDSALRPGTAWLATNMLQLACQPGGTAAEIAAAQLSSPIGGKTGTTDSFHDAWFVGFNPAITCGVWIGLDQPAPIIANGYSNRLAVPAWIRIVRQAESLGLKGPRFPSTPLRRITLCTASGQPAGPLCRSGTLTETLPADSLPTGPCPLHPDR